jgi:hypothetical protein
MARFAGSPSYQQRRKFEGPRLQSGSYRTNAGNAANWVSVGNIYGALNENTSDLGQVALTAMANKSRENIANATAEAFGISGFQDYMVKSEEADAAAKALRDEGRAKKKGGIISAVGSIASAAAPFAIAALSDETTKHTIDRIENACETLRQLKPVTFFYKEEYSSSPERMHHGFIAQDYQEVMPDATYYDESIGKLCIDTSELIALLVRANQELETRITRLEAKQALQAV